MRDLVKEQIDRCIECYALDIDTREEVTREGFEQMRADLLLVVGMLSALYALGQEEKA